MKRPLIVIILLLALHPQAQILFFQDTYKGGITSDGVSYFGMDYCVADTINFQLHIPTSSTIRKAFLLTQRSTYVCNHGRYDVPVAYNFNGNTIVLDSSNIITNSYLCDPTSYNCKNWMCAMDVTGLVQTSSNTLITPCQCCLLTDTSKNFVHDGYLLVVEYDDNSLPCVNSVIFLENQTLYSNVSDAFSNLNPINTTNDVGLSIWTEDVQSFSGNYKLTYSLTSSLGTFPLGTLDQTITGGSRKSLPGSFYYENNMLAGLVDDTPDAYIDSTDALANIKGYVQNNTVSFTLGSAGGAVPGCVDLRQAYILAYSTSCPPLQQPTYQELSICGIGSVQLNATSGASAYVWYPSTDLSNSSISNPTASPTVTTNYIATVTDVNGCHHTEHFKVNVKKNGPVIDSIIITNKICGISAGSSTVEAHNSTVNPYTFSIGNGTQNGNVFSNLSAGTYTLNVLDNANCVATKTFTIIEIIPTVANFTFSPTAVCLNDVVQFQNTSAQASGLIWTYNDTLFGNGNSTPLITANHLGTYSVSLIAWANAQQCSDTITKTFTVRECPPDSFFLSVPNIFSPNGDGVNEVWVPQIFNLGYSMMSFQATIYDRWGVKIFESSDVLKGWDGHTTSGIACSEGTYFFIVDYRAMSSSAEEKSGTFKGWLQLSR